ncbi:TIGR02221 family CRISPR-associated protein [Fusobacterium polymorphum]|uniref:CRISPR-associated protein n=1 Tax=Fusobacterium nucleatum subsp. polymorphum TaxID=76857 RepID=A0A2C6A2F9_FUSNP|nr:TIGR02221 family CRISPR-associated protein [Fusobacterium polymorphum]PHI05850.1 CRISPR-associated protein [Fusobacterium polymorphum]PHI12005.1 CRISPR-associated protein [Fusobacterium polymorphum]
MEKKKTVKRVLITSIGGGKTEDKDGVKILKKYEDTIYGIKKENGEFHMEKTSYMPLIIENTYNIDKTIIIGTTGSMWDNLYDIYWKKFKQDKIKDEKFKQSLIDVQVTSNRETPIDKINIDRFNQEFIGKVKGIVIKYGVSSKEISRNFDLIIKLQEEFNDTDEYEVFLDITHSFRSMAFWMFLIMNYLTDVSNKNIKIAGITYGMFEAKKDNITPIVILKPFLEILNWIKGASELKQYGNSYYILEKSDNNSLAKSIKDELRNFSNTMNMNYINSLLESIKNLKKLDTENELDKINGPAKHIIPNILKEFIKDFDLKEDDDNKRSYLLQATLAKWHCKQKRYAMSAINISEAIVTFVLLTLNIDSKKLKGKFDPDNDGQKWLKEIYKRYKDRTDLSKEEMQIYKYGELFVEVTRIRKEVAHSLGKQPDIIGDINKLEDYSNNIVDMLKNEDIIKRFENKLHILENLQIKNSNKNSVTRTVGEKKENSILLLSTKELSAEELKELKRDWQIDNMISLSEDELKLWKKASSEADFQVFKNIIDQYLINGNYILIHGNLKSMTKIKGYANTKGIISLCFLDPYSENKTFFEKY